MAAATKKTIYIEADDEIAHIIDQVVQAKENIVAIVLPKRATVFQSVVNVKLLKKAAAEAKKRVVLISSDPSVSRIAGVAGVHLASSLTSKPEIPKYENLAVSESVVLPEEVEGIDEDKNLGAAAVATAAVAANTSNDDEPIEMDNTDNAENNEVSDVTEEPEKAKKKAIKIPDFGSFKTKLTLGIIAFALLIGAWVAGFVIMPRATIAINADTSSETVTMPFSAQTAVKTLDTEKNIIPAVKVETTKEDKATVTASGKKDVGAKATGIVTLTNCRQGADGVTVPAGSSFSKGANTYLTTETVELGPAVYVGSNCVSGDFPSYGAVKDSGVVAANPGESYNQSAGSLQSSVSGVTAYGSDMTGGTTSIVAVVTAEDIQKAKDQLKGVATADALSELKKQLEDQQKQPLDETLSSTEPSVKSSHAADAEAPEVTVTQTVTYSLLGVNSSDLSTLLDSQIEKQLGDQKKNIRNNGLDKAVYRLVNRVSADDQALELQTVAILGAEFDTEAIKKEVAGKKRGDIEKMLESRDGVRSVGVEYSPFWVMSTPKSAQKINVVIVEVEN